MRSRPIDALIPLKLLRIPNIESSHTGETLSGNTKLLKKFSPEKDV
jgi:hypothetical protein